METKELETKVSRAAEKYKCKNGQSLDFQTDIVIFLDDSMNESECGSRNYFVQLYEKSSVKDYNGKKLFQLPGSGLWIDHGKKLKNKSNYIFYIGKIKQRQLRDGSIGTVGELISQEKSQRRSLEAQNKYKCVSGSENDLVTMNLLNFKKDDIVLIFLDDSLSESECGTRESFLDIFNKSNISIWNQPTRILFKLPYTGIWVENGRLLTRGKHVYYLKERKAEKIGDRDLNITVSGLHNADEKVATLAIPEQTEFVKEIEERFIGRYVVKPYVESKYYSDGKLESETPYVNGEKHGDEKRWYKNGQLWMEIPHVYGEKHGVEKWWYQNGQLWIETPYVNGKKHEDEKVWYENGQLDREIPYVNGEKHGMAKRWYENGQIMKEFPYVNGKIHGMAKQWYKNGQLENETPYVNGVISEL